MKKLIIKIRKIYFKLINSIIFKRTNVNHKNFEINGILCVKNKGRLVIDDFFNANSGKRYNPIGGDIILRLIVAKKDAELIIGKKVGISNSTIYCTKRVEIGDNVLIGGGCKIWDTDFHQINSKLRKSSNCIKSSSIKIGKNCFIGGQVIILKGVTIGDNCVIGAGSVITTDIPDNEIWAGNPAKFIKKH